MTDISEIFDIQNKKSPPKTRKRKDYTEDEKQKIKERLKLGKVKAAESREKDKILKIEIPKAITDIPKLEKDILPIPTIEKIITKHILELEESDGIDPKELKVFLSKLYKASKQKHVVDAMNNYDKPPEIIPTPKPLPTIQDKHPPPSQIIPPKQSKEELKAIQDQLAYNERRDKLKKILENKKKRH